MIDVVRILYSCGTSTCEFRLIPELETLVRQTGTAKD